LCRDYSPARNQKVHLHYTCRLNGLFCIIIIVIYFVYNYFFSVVIFDEMSTAVTIGLCVFWALNISDFLFKGNTLAYLISMLWWHSIYIYISLWNRSIFDVNINVLFNDWTLFSNVVRCFWCCQQTQDLVTPASLYHMAAILLQHHLVSLEVLFAHVSQFRLPLKW